MARAQWMLFCSFDTHRADVSVWNHFIAPLLARIGSFSI
jgi:hypothetical protein